MSFIKYFIFNQISETSLDPQETNTLLGVFVFFYLLIAIIFYNDEFMMELELGFLHAWTHSPSRTNPEDVRLKLLDFKNLSIFSGPVRLQRRRSPAPARQ